MTRESKFSGKDNCISKVKFMGNGNGIEGFVNFDIGYCHALMKLLYVVQIEL